MFPACLGAVSSLACVLWGLGRMAGFEPAASTVGGWRSGLLGYICSVCQPRLLVCVGLGAYLSVSFMSVRGVRCFRQPYAVVAGDRAHCEGEAGAVCSGSVVALCGEEGQLGFVSVDHDEDGVFFPAYQAGLRNLLL